MRLAQDSGVRVLNDPAGLQRASGALYTVFLPDHLVPKTLVCHSLAEVQTFANQLISRFVLKPLVGSEGQDIFFLDSPDAINTRQVVEILGRNGYMLAQEFIPEASEGDIREFTLDDSIILGAGRAMGVRRVPGEGELRSNVSLVFLGIALVVPTMPALTERRRLRA
ncbi:MAG: glutathione synthase [Mariniblastus sp.]|jgi:glutathione synthase